MRLFALVFILSCASVAMAQSAKDGGKPPQKGADTCADPCRSQGQAPPPPITINVSPTQTLNPEAHRDPKGEQNKAEWEKGTAIGTIAMAVVTFALAVAAFLQRSDLKDTSRKELRAY